MTEGDPATNNKPLKKLPVKFSVRPKAKEEAPPQPASQAAEQPSNATNGGAADSDGSGGNGALAGLMSAYGSDSD